VVDESFSEQEDSYFREEPRKSEVVECYYEVFVNNKGNDNNEDNNSDTESNNINDNNKEPEIEDEEDEPEEETLFG
jgi:hypothetical protein